jgi:hypothetical protein
MIKENRRFETVACVGGLDLESNPLQIPAGSMILCQNYDVKAGGGYRRVGGYERFDGQEAPSVASDPDAARAAIGYVPSAPHIDGVGQVQGIHYFKGALYAVRISSDGYTSNMYKSTPAGWELVGTVGDAYGTFEFITHNFYGNTDGERMFWVDGVNRAKMFDGTTISSISPAGETTAPTHIAAHSNHLFLAYPDGQYVHSAIGDPTDWDAATGGAGAYGAGDEIVGMRPTVGGALAIFMRNKISILYGTSQDDWLNKDLRTQQDRAGAREFSIQDLGDLFYLDDRGLTTMSATQSFGNFMSGTIDRPIKRYVLARKNDLCGSCISRDRNQYMMFFRHPEGTEVISLTLGNQSLDGYSRALYPFKADPYSPLSICSTEDENGEERIFVGAGDRYVYELEKGTSFDGAEIESYLKLSFSHLRSPNTNKFFRSLIIGLEAETNLTLQIKPEFDYGSREHGGHRAIDASLLGGGGAWENTNWNEFNWSAQIVSEARVDIGGIGRNLAILVYHKSATDKPFIVYDATIQYSLRGTRR